MGKGPRRDAALERQWREIVEDQTRSGLTIQAFCHQRNVSASSFHQWKRELKRREEERSPGRVSLPKRRELGDFMPVMVTTATPAIEIEIEVAGAIIRVRRGFDEEALARALHVLRQVGGPTREADRC